MKQYLVLIALQLVSTAWPGTATAASEDPKQAVGGSYVESTWKAFAARHAGDKAMQIQTLCMSAKNREVELLRINARRHGNMYRLLLTARHDADDTAGSYVLEGMLDALTGEGDDGKWLRERKIGRAHV